MDITAPGRELHERFLALGNMTGTTMEQVIAAVGQPTSISSLAAGRLLLQWQATGCHMALLFGADRRFIKITHQHARYAPAKQESLPSSISTTIGIVIGIALLLTFVSLRLLR